MDTILAPRYANAIAPRYAPLRDYGFPMLCMKTVEEVRRERLAQLRQEAGSLVALNEKLGLSSRDATLSQILNAAKNSRTGTPKQMGSKLARDLETACGKEVGWMDTDPALLDGGASAPPEIVRMCDAVTQLPPKQREWLLTVVQQALDIAHEAIAVTTNPVSAGSGVAAEQPPLSTKRANGR